MRTPQAIGALALVAMVLAFTEGCEKKELRTQVSPTGTATTVARASLALAGLSP